MNQISDIAESLYHMADIVSKRESAIGTKSTGEAIGIALVLNRTDLLPEGYTILEAVNRLGDEWTQAALLAQRMRS